MLLLYKRSFYYVIQIKKCVKCFDTMIRIWVDLSVKKMWCACYLLQIKCLYPNFCWITTILFDYMNFWIFRMNNFINKESQYSPIFIAELLFTFFFNKNEEKRGQNRSWREFTLQAKIIRDWIENNLKAIRLKRFKEIPEVTSGI